MYIIIDPINRLYCVNGWIYHYPRITNPHPFMYANPVVPPVPPTPPTPPVRR